MHSRPSSRSPGVLLPAVLLLSLAGCAVSAGELESLDFQHHDWLLACDNTRTCRAAGYQDESLPGPPVSVLLTRAAGPGTPVEGRVMLGQYEETPMPSTLELRIDGRSLGAVDFHRARGTGELSPAQVEPLVAALGRDSGIGFHGDGDRGPWRLSDSGAAAVLLKMDEFQGRLDTPGALVRRGARSEGEVPPPLAVPVVRAVEPVPSPPGDARLVDSPQLRAALLEAVADPEDCRDLLDEERAGPLESTRLDRERLLVWSRCWTGAYNEGIGYWVVNEAAPHAPRLVTTSASWHEGGEIRAMQKGRGLGDCFWHAGWVWNGNRFVQTDDSRTGPCRLVAPGGPWYLPRLVRDVEH